MAKKTVSFKESNLRILVYRITHEHTVIDSRECLPCPQCGENYLTVVRVSNPDRAPGFPEQGVTSMLCPCGYNTSLGITETTTQEEYFADFLKPGENVAELWVHGIDSPTCYDTYKPEGIGKSTLIEYTPIFDEEDGVEDHSVDPNAVWEKLNE